MSNGGPNTGTPESAEAMPTKKERSINATGLLKAAIERELGSPIDPKKYDNYIAKNDSVINNIRGNIDDLRGFSDEDWSGITDEDVTKIKNEILIRESMIKSCQDLVINRKKLTDRVRSRFPGIGKIPDWQRKFVDAIAGMDETVLYNTFLHAPRMKQLVRSTFPDFHDDDIERNFEKIFFDIGTVGNATNEALVKKIHREYERYGVPPSKEKIAYLLDIYKGTSVQRKKEVLSAIGATLSLGYAIDNGIITDQYLEGFARTNFGELYEKLTPEQKKAFKNNLKSKKELTVSIDELDDANLEKVFGPKVLERLAEDIAADLSVNKKEVNIPKGGVMEKIKEELEKQGKTDWDIHTEFLRYVEQNLRTQDRSKCTIENIGNLKDGSVIVFGEGENAKYLRLSATTGDDGLPLDVYNGAEAGVRIEGLPVQNGRITGSERSELSYDHFYDLLSKGGGSTVLSKEEFQAKLTTESSEAGKEGKLYDARHLEGGDATATNIKDKIDLIDSAGIEYGFKEGTFFIAPGKEDGKTSDEIWKVHKIHGDQIDLMNANGGIDANLPINGVFKVLETSGSFKRIGIIQSDDEFLSKLTDSGIPHETKIDGGKLVHEKDDGHGTKKKHTLSILTGKGDKGHIRLEKIAGGLITFREEKKSGTKDEILSYAEKNGESATLKEYYSEPKKLTYQAFIEYLKNNKFEEAQEDYLKAPESDNHHGEHEHSHLEGSFWSRVGKMQNFSSIWKGFEMITHSIEHTLEKGSKLDAAKFALGTSNFLHLPETIKAQLYADIVDGSKEIVEKYQKKIQNLPGPSQRIKCIHIVHNTDARPEEVMAAIGFMVSSYGHLYAEDNKHYQSVVTKKGLETKIDGTYAYLDAFIRSTRMPAREGKPAYIYWRLKAYEKARQEAGTEGEPAEEQLLHALFKSIDGNPDEFPYAASVVKAIGGPGGFEKMWKFDGTKNAIQKGRDQTTMVNAQGRLNKAVGYLATHEIYKAMGSMELVAKKNKSPKFQAMPFIWAVGGFTKYASGQAIQDLKNYGENGYSFHAFAFLRTEEDNTTYKETVRLALGELEKQGRIGKGVLEEFDEIVSRIKHTGKPKEKTNTPEMDLMRFWQKYQGAGLHDMLQNTNGWLTKVSKQKNEHAVKYREKLTGAHLMLLHNASVPSGELGADWYDEHGYESLIMGSNEDGLKTLESNLIKIKFLGTNRGGRPMNRDDKDKIWNYVKNYMTSNKGLRDMNMFLGDEALQKEQFMVHRAELFKTFAGFVSASEVKDPADINRLINSPEYEYYKDFEAMGIDPRGIFNYETAAKNAESDYQNWKNNRSVGGSEKKVNTVLEQIQGRAAGTSGANLREDQWHDRDDTKGDGTPSKPQLDGLNEGSN